MKVKTIRAVRSRTVNLGDFESTRVEYEMSAELEDGEDEAKAMEALDLLVRNQIKTSLARIDRMLERRREKERRDQEQAGE